MQGPARPASAGGGACCTRSAPCSSPPSPTHRCGTAARPAGSPPARPSGPASTPCRTRPPAERRARAGRPRPQAGRWTPTPARPGSTTRWPPRSCACAGPGTQPWTAPAGLTFRDWLRGGGERPPTLEDLSYHLSTLFPPVRPRGHLEYRVIDAQPGDGWIVPAAVVTALLDDEAASQAAMAAAEALWHTAGTAAAATSATRPVRAAGRAGTAAARGSGRRGTVPPTRSSATSA